MGEVMPYILPIEVTDLEAANNEIEIIKNDIDFDRTLSEILALRQVYRGKIGYTEQRKYVSRILPDVRRKVNTLIHEVVCADNYQHFHSVNPSATLVYVREDVIESLVRKIVFRFYDDDVHNKLKRQKATGCIQAICYVLNSDPVFD